MQHLHLYVYVFERAQIGGVRSLVIPTKASNIWSGVAYLSFSRILNYFLFVFFDLTFCRYVQKHSKACTLNMSYTRFVFL